MSTGSIKWNKVLLAVCASAVIVACGEEAPTSTGGGASINSGPGSAIGNVIPIVRDTEVMTRLRTVADVVDVQRGVTGFVPASVDLLVAEEVLPAEAADDPWGNRMRIEATDDGYRVWSIGPDAEDGTDDDIEMIR